MTETCSISDTLTQTLLFEGQKRAQNDGFGSKSSYRKSEEVRLGPEWAGHLPRCCARANTGPRVINHDNITLRPSLKHSFGLIWGLWGPLEASRGQTKKTMVGIKVVYAILEQVGSV